MSPHPYWNGLYTPVFQRRGYRKIPLDAVYTTTRQKDAKDAVAQWKDVPTPYFGKWILGDPVIFLLNGKDFRAAFQRSRPFLQLQGDARPPAPNAGCKSGQQAWVGAYLGSAGSIPPPTAFDRSRSRAG